MRRLAGGTRGSPALREGKDAILKGVQQGGVVFKCASPLLQEDKEDVDTENLMNEVAQIRLQKAGTILRKGPDRKEKNDVIARDIPRLDIESSAHLALVADNLKGVLDIKDSNPKKVIHGCHMQLN